MRIGRVAALAALLLTAAACPRARAEDPPAAPRDVDLVLVLDTSTSMQALIDTARDKLGKVITSIATATPEPNLRLALLTYGTPEGDSDAGPDVWLDGHVRLRADLTYNFDRVFDELDRVRVGGGHEYVGRALYHTIRQMRWTRDSLRIVFVAGNESADQDREMPANQIAKQMARRGMRLNAIYCGGADDGIADGWKALAEAGKGRFASIDHNHGTVNVASPFDKELASLSRALTRSHARAGLPQTRMALMQKVDRRAEAVDLAVAAERAASKATPLFRAPAPKDDVARKAHDVLLERIRALAKRRAAHVARAVRERALDDGQAFDRALLDALRAQLAKAGFSLPPYASSVAPKPTR